MNQKIISCFVFIAGSLLLTATNGYSFGSFGNAVNAACAPVVPYAGSCLLCHTGIDEADPTAAKDAFLAGGATLTNFFCPPALPTCTDADGDGFAVEGGGCGPVDCNDFNGAVNPAAAENCHDGVDNNCNFLVDIQDPAVVNCDTSLFDTDGDGFTPAAGDCNDANAAINPTAVEVCTDGVDNNCNNLIDTMDPSAVSCPLICTDADGDGYSLEGGECGPVDCNDANAAANPGAVEVCDTRLDNDCDGRINEGCDLTCPAGSGVIIKSIEWDRADRKTLTLKGRSFVEGGSAVGSTITILDADTGETIKEAFEVTRTGGAWKAVIRRVRPTLRNISIVSSNGCTLDQRIFRAVYRSN